MRVKGDKQGPQLRKAPVLCCRLKTGLTLSTVLRLLTPGSPAVVATGTSWVCPGHSLPMQTVRTGIFEANNLSEIKQNQSVFREIMTICP